MLQELRCLRKEIQTSNPVVVGVEEIEKKKLKTEGLEWTLEIKLDVYLDEWLRCSVPGRVGSTDQKVWNWPLKTNRKFTWRSDFDK